MFIVWGKKLVRREAGFVADFCPICRCKQAFKLTRVGVAGHVYYVSVGEGTLVGFERTCLACATSYQTDAGVYKSVAEQQLPLPELVARTYPDMDRVLADRLALEEKVLRTPKLLTSDERHALIRNPFLLLSPKVEEYFSSTRFDKETTLAGVAMLILVMLTSAVSDSIAPGSAGPAILVALGAGVSLVVWQLLQSGPRFMRRQVIPNLARALRPLAPSDNEMKAALVELKSLGHKVGTKLNLADLREQLSHRGGAVQVDDGALVRSRA
jgi:hypothetical protein